MSKITKSSPPSSNKEKTNGKKMSGKISSLFNCFSRGNGSQASAVQVKKEAVQNSPSKVLEQIKANQEQIQEAMSKMQIQITKYGESLATIGKDENILKIPLHNAENNAVGYNGKFTPIRKTIRLELKNCKELFKKEEEFDVWSGSIEVLRFGCRLSILNAFHGKDLVKEKIGSLYDYDVDVDDHSSFGIGFFEMAEFKDLLDPEKVFLRADGSIEVEVDFTIKCSTLDHLV